MSVNAHIENSFLEILNEELVPAMGCTEPIALAYAAARMRDALGRRPESMVARCSGNIIKNVRCVQIPNSNGMVGIEAAVTLGAFGGDSSRMMEVLVSVQPSDIADSVSFIQAKNCRVEFLDSEIPLHFIIEGSAGGDTALVEVCHSHTNIVLITKNGETIFEGDRTVIQSNHADRSGLCLANIKDFSDNVALEKIKPLYDRVIACNMAIAEEGLTGKYGVAIGPMLKEEFPDGVVNRMKYWAASGSEARMAGCDMPVIINSGSGNQGIASTVPVIVYCRETGVSEERMLRALAFSSLVCVFQKEFIGKLSAYCGAISATCASGAAVAYLSGGTLQQISDTISNTLACTAGMICDGAKASCAIKIAACLDAAMMSFRLAMRGNAYAPFSGILGADGDQTIANAGHVGRIGMRETDREILRLMVGSAD